jgi:hypothetical protein
MLCEQLSNHLQTNDIIKSNIRYTCDYSDPYKGILQKSVNTFSLDPFICSNSILPHPSGSYNRPVPVLVGQLPTSFRPLTIPVLAGAIYRDEGNNVLSASFFQLAAPCGCVKNGYLFN